MQMPQVLILARNEFHRRLMTDLVACNEMRVVASDRLDRVEQVESGAFRADVVVIDCRMEADEVDSALGRLRAIPDSRRPRLVAVSASEDRARQQGFEECLSSPLDIGEFARRVKGQAQAHLLTLEA